MRAPVLSGLALWRASVSSASAPRALLTPPAAAQFSTSAEADGAGDQATDRAFQEVYRWVPRVCSATALRSRRLCASRRTDAGDRLVGGPNRAHLTSGAARRPARRGRPSAAPSGWHHAARR